MYKWSPQCLSWQVQKVTFGFSHAVGERHPTRDILNSLSMAPTSTVKPIPKEHSSLLLYLKYFSKYLESLPLLLHLLGEQPECVLLSTSVFPLLFQIWWRIRCSSVCLSLCPVYSCLPPRTVSFPHWRRGEQKKKKKKVFHFCPKISSDYCPHHVPICPLCPSCSGPVMSSFRTSQIITAWLLPAGR